MISLFPSRTVAFELFGFGVHWYGLLYLAAFLIGWVMLPRIQKLRSLALSDDAWSSIFSATVLGVIIGGRLGYVLFYAPSYYLAHPLEIIAVWQGGMASHGGFIGVALALLYVLRDRTREEILRIGDLIVIPVAIGLGLGRIGNFINQELYGTVTSLPWGVSFHGAIGLRHPIQLYDFVLMCGIAFLCYRSLHSKPVRPGRTGSLFLLCYGVVRFLIEYIRQPDAMLFDFGIFTLTQGQLLTIPIVLMGGWLWVETSRVKK